MSDLQRLFYWRGVAPEFHNYRGELTPIPIENRLNILRAMSVDISSEKSIAAEAFELDIKPWLQWLPALEVIEQQSQWLDVNFQPDQMDVNTYWKVSFNQELVCSGEVKPETLEEVGNYIHDGDRYSRRRIPLSNLDIGYYDVSITQEYDDLGETQASRIAIVPDSSYIPSTLSESSDAETQPWGVMIQLYTLRSRHNWGIGDFSDLRALITELAARGADIIGLNPFHSLLSDLNTYFSPYSPSDRRFLNPLYIDVTQVVEIIEDDVGETAAKLRRSDKVDYVEVRALKYNLLYEQFLSLSQVDRQALSEFIGEGGKALKDYAKFESAQFWQPKDWIDHYQSTDEYHERLIRFYCYLQWLANEQLSGCQEHAKSLDMKVGLVRDLAVGASRAGSEVKTNPELFCDDASVGAPPDPLALTGQNWGIPPPDPAEMRRSGYAHFIALLRSNMVSCGALRIDHAMSLMRLWWCPPSGSADEGVYIYYPFKEMLGLLCLESHLNKCIVIAEDLGIVPDEFREQMRHTNLLSNRVFYFEKWNDVEFKSPHDYEGHALAMLNNHDVPTLVSWWSASDLKLRSDLNMLAPGSTLNDATAFRNAEKRHLLELLTSHQKIPESWLDKTEEDNIDQSLVFAIIRYAAAAKSKFYLIQLEDLLLMDEPVNVPGTFKEYDNWCRKLTHDLEDIFDDEQRNALLSSLSACR